MNTKTTIQRLNTCSKNGVGLYIRVLTICLLYSFSLVAQSNYLKGQIRDDQGKGLSNLRIDLQSCGTTFLSGSDGFFGITTPRQFDTLIIYYSNRDTVKRSVNSNEFNTVIIRSEKILNTRTARKLSSISLNLNQRSSISSYLENETYAITVENPFFNTGSNTSTSLALSYNRASYSNVRRFLNMNETVPPDAVRPEELLNYFPWNYEVPEEGKTFRIQGSLSPCPWNKEHQLLMVRLCSRKPNLEDLPPSHLVFLIDVSGSMNLPNRLPLLKSAFRVLVNNLRSRDTVSLVAYGGYTRVLLNAISGSEKEKIINVIDSLEPAGNTPGESGIRVAYRLAKRHYIKGGNNRVILATDGDFNVGIHTDEELETLIASQKEAGIYLTCLGVGMGDYKDSKIQALAQKGSGNFAYLDNYAEAEKVLYHEFFQTLYTVADNVVMNVSFNPGKIKEYRLIGYDNKISSLRDRQALIQGGEIGAGNSLLIAFEVHPQTFNAADTLAGIRICFTNKEGQDQAESYTVLGKDEEATPERSTQLATAIIMFGMKIRKSPEASFMKWDQIFTIARTGVRPGNYAEQEFLQMIHQGKMVYRKHKKFWLF